MLRRTRQGRRFGLGVVLATVCLGTACTAGSGQHDAVVQVSPHRSRLTQPVSIRVDGLASDTAFTVRMSSTDAAGTHWASSARFRSNHSGVIDLDHARSLGGSYRGVDGMGLMESLAAEANKKGAYRWSGSRRFRITVRPKDGKPLAHATIRRRAAPGVEASKQTVGKQGFDGIFYRKPGGSTRRPAILTFGGSEGGNTGGLVGAALAAAGYPTLTIAYFHAPGLPKHLVKIPLEYFATALRWLARQPGVDPHHVYIRGVSRGSEAAQLVAVHYPSLVQGVVLGVPSNVVQQGLVGGTGLAGEPAGASAWSFGGTPVPYAKNVNDPHPTQVPQSVIPVERIKAPMFLVCGGADQVWRSCPFAHAIIERLTAHHDRYRHVLAEYPEAGHGVGSMVPYEPASGAPAIVGRHPRSNQIARAKVWPRLLHFLHTTSGTH